MANNLGRLRVAKRWTQEQAAVALGTTRSQYVKLESGARRLSDPWIDRAALAYGVDPAAIVQSSVFPPVVGRLLGDGGIKWAGDHQIGDGRQVAISVNDNALGLMVDGCFVVFKNQPASPQGSYNGLLAIVERQTPSLSTLRRIYDGSCRGRFHLVGYNIPPEFDSSVISLTPIEGFRFI